MATSLIAGVALITSSSLIARPLTNVPPFVIDVIAASDISPSLVERVLAEAGDIWRAAGLTIVWKQDGRVSSALRVTIGHWANRIRRDETTVPLGWIVFDDDGAPEHAIYVSYANASLLMDQTRGTTGPADKIPRAERETLLSRAMGRALAHELGHYLLASKAHSVKGLMRAKRTAAEFFSIDKSRFDLDAGQRAAIAARLIPAAALASLQSPVASQTIR
ncbi:MAG TPA: hypothetical protein VGQ16_04690 [Vicinamibacterales bacterium]|nr:hypothetical protein [Vicinamibacterales bacterium]